MGDAAVEVGMGDARVAGIHDLAVESAVSNEEEGFVLQDESLSALPRLGLRGEKVQRILLHGQVQEGK